MVKLLILAVKPLASVITVEAWLPSIASRLAPGPRMVTFLLINKVLPLSTMLPVMAKKMLSPEVAATVMASRSVQVDVQLPGPLSALELTRTVAARAGCGVVSKGRQISAAKIRSEMAVEDRG